MYARRVKGEQTNHLILYLYFEIKEPSCKHFQHKSF